jgi:FkbM family methyltransferase
LIIDLGANVVFFALRFADQWIKTKGQAHNFKLIDIEGTPKTYEELVRRTEYSGSFFFKESCEYYLGLVGQKSGFGYITKSSFHGTNSLLEENSLSTEKVSFINLENIIPKSQKIALLKCDIEGAEEQFIRSYSGLLQRVEIAVFELHHNLCDTQVCIQLLKDAGLSDRKILREFDGCSVELFTRK